MPLLAADTINEAIVVRATGKESASCDEAAGAGGDPAMHASMATMAAAEIKEAFGS